MPRYRKYRAPKVRSFERPRPFKCPSCGNTWRYRYLRGRSKRRLYARGTETLSPWERRQINHARAQHDYDLARMFRQASRVSPGAVMRLYECKDPWHGTKPTLQQPTTPPATRVNEHRPNEQQMRRSEKMIRHKDDQSRDRR